MHAHRRLSVGMKLILQDVTAELRLTPTERAERAAYAMHALRNYMQAWRYGLHLQVIPVANLHLFLPLRQLRPPEHVGQVLAVQLQRVRGHAIHWDASA